MTKTYTSIRIKCIAGLLVPALLFSCSNDPEALQEMEEKKDLPTEVSINTEIIYSDSAVIRVKLNTPELVRYSDEDNPYVEFPQGLNLLLFDSLGNQESSLKANYGVNYPDEQRIEVKNDVEVINVDGEKLNTEHLIWSRKDGKIYTEEFVKITTEDEIIYGDGLESNENFTNYRIKNIKGSISVQDEEEAGELSADELQSSNFDS